LELAVLNESELQRKYARNLIEEKNKYYYFNNYFNFSLNIERTEEFKLQYVSKNNDGEIMGFAEAFANRSFNLIQEFRVINFTGKPNIICSRDFIRLLEIIFCKRKFRKLVFHVIKDNPALKMYKKFFVEKTKMGRIVGELKEHCILTDGECYDLVMFEILRKDFISWYERRK